MAGLANFAHSSSLPGNKMSSHGRGEEGTCIGQTLHWKSGILLFIECAFIPHWDFSPPGNMHTKASQTKDSTELRPSVLLLSLPFKQNTSLDALFFFASLCISFLLSIFPLPHTSAHSSPPFPLLPPTISPSVLPPSSSSLRGSRRVWHFYNSRRGICTQPRPMLGKASVGVARLTEVSVCLSLWLSTCGWIPHIRSNNMYFLPCKRQAQGVSCSNLSDGIKLK